jgi:hypothetical protein
VGGKIMSTVEEVYDSIKYRPDININADDLIPIMNMSLRTIAKRLYVLESSLIVDEMAVKIFKSVDYTASMACVATGFTDAAAQFIVEGFVIDMPITTTQASNPGPFRISTVAVDTLTVSTVVTPAVAGVFKITSDDAYGYLPDDFWGLKDKPYISGKKYPLLPLPSVDVELQYLTGDPIYYKVRGDKIYVTPHTGSDYTIVADYFQKPTSLTTTTDTVPFNELFDDLIAEYLTRYFRGKPSGVDNALLDEMLFQGVDLVAAKYDKAAPATPSGINWDLGGGYAR